MMRKLYLISNYHSETYSINEDDTCTIERRDEEPFDLTIEQTIDLFRQCPTVKTYGIMRAEILQKNEEGKFRPIERVL